MRLFDLELAPPPHTDLESANAEIRRLQNALLQANDRLAQQFEKRQLDNKSNAGQIAALRKELEASKQELLDYRRAFVLKLRTMETALELSYMERKKLQQKLSIEQFELKLNKDPNG